MKVNVKINEKFFSQTKKQAEIALILTAEALKTDLQLSQTMPFGESKTWTSRSGEQRTYLGGNLQNKSTYTNRDDINKGIVSVVSDTPYARRLYYHPEYNFNKTENKNAGGMWFEPYINGEKKNFATEKFEKFMERSK